MAGESTARPVQPVRFFEKDDPYDFRPIDRDLTDEDNAEMVDEEEEAGDPKASSAPVPVESSNSDPESPSGENQNPSPQEFPVEPEETVPAAKDSTEDKDGKSGQQTSSSTSNPKDGKSTQPAST